MGRLDEIEERLKASRTRTRDHAHDVSPDPLIGCRGCATADYAQLDLNRNALADLALLARLVSSVAGAECERKGPLNRSLCQLAYEHGLDLSSVCWPCRIRRELAAAEVGR